MTSETAAEGNWDLCANAREIAGVIGRGDALFLISKYLKWDRGGQRGKSSSIYIPKRLKPDHQLIALVGQDNAAKLVRAFGGENLHVSSSPAPRLRSRDEAIRREAAAGTSNATLAFLFDMTERHIRNIIRGVPRNAPPPANDNAE